MRANKQSAILTEQEFRAAVAKQCGVPPSTAKLLNKVYAFQEATEAKRQLKDREPTDAEVLSALQFALNDWNEKAEHENDLRYESRMADESEYGPMCNERDEIGGRQ